MIFQEAFRRWALIPSRNLRALFLLLPLCLATKVGAQGTFSAVSTNDGSGQFGWTFSVTGGSFPGIDHFQMRLYGVQETFNPQGWAAVIDAADTVTWSYVGGGAGPFSGSPLTFSIRSLSTQSIAYGGIGNVTYPDGLYWGDLLLGRFAYDGPQIPEPATGLCWLLAMGFLAARVQCRGSRERRE
jgi:hypothetical protein